MSTMEMSGHLVLCNWSSRGLDWIREVHSGIVADKRPVVIIHDTPDDIELPDKQDDPAFTDVYIVKGDPASEVILKRAKVPQAHSVVVLADDRQGPHADGKTIVCCIAVKAACRGDAQPNVVVECRDPKYRPHLRKAGADEVISASEFGLRLLARAALFHGMTRVYQELLTVGRDANEMYLVPIPAGIVGQDVRRHRGAVPGRPGPPGRLPADRRLPGRADDAQPGRRRGRPAARRGRTDPALPGPPRPVPLRRDGRRCRRPAGSGLTPLPDGERERRGVSPPVLGARGAARRQAAVRSHAAASSSARSSHS